MTTLMRHKRQLPRELLMRETKKAAAVFALQTTILAVSPINMSNCLVADAMERASTEYHYRSSISPLLCIYHAS